MTCMDEGAGATLDVPNLDEIERAAAILRRGGLVAFPTETVYGLGAWALDPAALGRIFAAKGRPANHPLIAHVLDAAGGRALASSWPVLAARLAEAFWPGPLTLVVPRAAHVPLALTGGGDSVAVRAPAHPVARALLAAFGEPIAAPSANRYQSLSPTTAAHVRASLGERVDMILDGGPCSAGIESTVVDVRGEAPVILRPGALDLPTLAAVVPGTTELVATVASEDSPHVSPGQDRRHYSPKTPLLVAATRDAAVEAARDRMRRGQRVGMLLMRPLEQAGASVRSLGVAPASYARQLFSALHELDGLGVDVIVVEPVPETAPWRAVADRLRRGATAR